MLDYLLAILIAPLLRLLLGLCLRLMAFAFMATIPARLWLQFVAPQPSARTVMAINAFSLGLLSALVVLRRCRRRS